MINIGTYELKNIELHYGKRKLKFTPNQVSYFYDGKLVGSKVINFDKYVYHAARHNHVLERPTLARQKVK